jgi:GTP-binding protein HflX
MENLMYKKSKKVQEADISKKLKKKEEFLQTETLLELSQDQKRALLVGTYVHQDEQKISLDNLEELKRLADTFGLETIEKIDVYLRRFTPATYIGRGKIQELKKICFDLDIHVLLFDEELSPHQQRNLEKTFQIPVIDRTELILGVFAQRAKSKEAQIQIELAQQQYQLPRLRRMWTHLSRQRTGGSSGGYLKGEGERQIELDRRIVRSRISFLEKELKKVRQHRDIQRQARERNQIPTFAIVGYTNSGKSTLLHALTDAEVLIEDKLFATLDTTTRKFFLPNRQQILLIDTVGFIRKIPHTLIAAFRSTLEEAAYADILLHMVDVSHPQAVEQAQESFAVLKELKALDRPMITCFNKIDACKDRRVIFQLKTLYPRTVEISAKEKIGFDHLLERMTEQIRLLRKEVKLRIPQAHYSIVSRLMKEGKVLFCDYAENDILLDVEIPASLEKSIKDFVVRAF